MLDLEKLNYKERESYQKMLELVKAKQLTLSDFKDRLQESLYASIRDLVELENNQDEKNTYLKARIKNYLVLLDMLTVPEVVEKQMAAAVKKAEERIK